MTVHPILTWPDPRLSQVCAPAEGDVSQLADDMLETMYAAPGRGLAAPQIGVLKRIFVMDATWKDADPSPMVFINPEITWASSTQVACDEGCLSIPGATTTITRPDRVTMQWQDVNGQPDSQTFDGFAAACVQHELDHLNGIVTFDRLDPDARAMALAEYAP